MFKNDHAKPSMVRSALHVLAVFSVLSTPAWAEEPGTLSPGAKAGQAFFLSSCATCHGIDGRGAGPTAAAMKTSPSDLTLISQRRAGAFPTQELADIIDGRFMVTAHGDRKMPVWGERFSEDEDGDRMTEHAIQERLGSLLEYLRSIQR